MTELIFASLQPDARSLILEIGAMTVQVTAAGEFTVDLGPNPVIGDSWPVGYDLQVGGFPVHIRAARLMEETLPGWGDRVLLAFDMDLVADHEDQKLRALMLRGLSSALPGATASYDEKTGRLKAALELERGATVPPGRLTVQVVEAAIEQTGPWQVTWDVPQGATGTP